MPNRTKSPERRTQPPMPATVAEDAWHIRPAGAVSSLEDYTAALTSNISRVGGPTEMSSTLVEGALAFMSASDAHKLMAMTLPVLRSVNTRAPVEPCCPLACGTISS